MTIELGTRLRVCWDYDSYESGDVTGTVVGLLPDVGRSVPACVVRLDSRLVTLGVLRSGGPPVEAAGCFLVLVPRYAGQTWVDDDGTAHAGLSEDEPAGPFDSAQLWPIPKVASHAVYRIIT